MLTGFIIFSFLEFYFCISQKEKMRKIFKVVPILFLIALIGTYKIQNPIVYLAICFGMIGDLFLISWNKKMLFAGIISFFVEHVLVATYIYTLHSVTFDWYYIFVVLVGMLIVFAGYWLVTKKFLPVFFRCSCTVYTSMLLFNVISLIVLFFIFKDYKYLILFFAYIIFAFSDSLVMRKRFIGDTKYLKFFVMLTYYAAQLLITSAFIFL